MGTWNSTTLPVLTTQVENIEAEESFENHYSIVCFLGDDLSASKTAISNLNEVIYKRFHQALYFQTVVILPNGMELEIEALKKRLGTYTDASQWNFVFVSKEELVTIFNSFDTPYILNDQYASNYTFIVDKELNLRGRTDDEDTKDGKLYGYDMTSVAVLRNKMRKDIEVIYYHLKEKRKKEERERNKGKVERLKER
ncbi:MAG: hypothetical protein COA67_08345 [Lutibacter sp.]|nr:MAG: hypothetical protein COA67_08345 [Lutibacter sp.]